jgi:hypothetical protein
VKGRGFEAERVERVRRLFEADHATAGEGGGEDTVELLRDMMQDALDRLARSRRRRDPVMSRNTIPDRNSDICFAY